MRFINDFDWKKTMQYGWRRILRALVRPFAALRLKFRRLSNPNTLVNTVGDAAESEGGVCEGYRWQIHLPGACRYKANAGWCKIMKDPADRRDLFAKLPIEKGERRRKWNI